MAASRVPFGPKKQIPTALAFTAGSDKINYLSRRSCNTNSRNVSGKILFNSVLSTPGAKFMTMDISNFYLMTPLLRPEYIRIKLIDLPSKIITEEYKLRDKTNKKGHIFLKVVKGMYGLPQAGLLANELLEKRLNNNKHGYYQSKIVPGLWKHTTWPIQFTLVVDDFGVKYVGQEHAEHLKQVLKEHYKVTADWTGERYVGIHLKWDYNKRQCHPHMPGYIKKAFPHTPITYGAKKQYAKEETQSPPWQTQ